MKTLKYIFLLIPLFTIVTFSNALTTINNINFNISIVETAYEIYSLESFDETFYKDNNAQKHYIWLLNYKNNLDKTQKKELSSLFEDVALRNYIKFILENDILSFNDLILNIKNDNSLGLTDTQKDDFKNFFTSFYNDFNFYFNKQSFILSSKISDIKNSVDNFKYEEFIKELSGKNFNDNYDFNFYYSLSPKFNHLFKTDKNIVSIITSSHDAKDIIRICSDFYVDKILNELNYNTSFFNTSMSLKSNHLALNDYENYRNSYSFKEYLIENLNEGFLKYLDYKFYNITYDFSNYTYDLDFYNYLITINFDPTKYNLIDECINFYVSKED